VKQKVLDILTEGEIKSYWIEGEDAYNKCLFIKKFIRKSLEADTTSIYNYIHTIDKDDFISSVPILFDLEKEALIHRFYTSQIVSGFPFMENKIVSLSGRISSVRDLGGILFFRINDRKGALQIVIQKERDCLKSFRNSFKEGDIVLVFGSVKKSKSGEISIFAQGINILSETEIPFNIDYNSNGKNLPFQRLLFSKNLRRNMCSRSIITNICRSKLIEDGNIEVESPILNKFFNGGLSTPFVVKNKNIKEEQYLRVTSELYLKQFVIGGIEGVFEIGKQFRGGSRENISSQEYTALEFYRAYKDYFWMMEYIENLFRRVLVKTKGESILKWFGNEINLMKEWERITFYEVFLKHTGIDIYKISDRELEKLSEKHMIKGKDRDSRVVSLFKILVVPMLISPTFVYNYPSGISPLTKINSQNRKEILKFGGYISGKKIIDGSMEETDKEELNRRLFIQKERKKVTRKELLPYDESFLKSMRYGMPPVVGTSISMDRMSMLFTESNNIREVNIFAE
jgi:lysyl-tRNA synthetase class 2